MNKKGYVTLSELTANQPSEAQARVEAKYQKMVRQVEDFRAIRQVIAQSQSELAQNLDATEESFCKLERRTERTLRRFAAKMGGDLEIAILLPDHPPIRLDTPSIASSLSLEQPTTDASA